MKDVLGNVLEIGNRVITTCQHFKELRIGTVERFTNHFIIVNGNRKKSKQVVKI